jgi:hypothetical protein
VSHAARIHDRFSPSGAHRWLHCPGSVLACEREGVKDTSNEASELGTAAHELLEAALKSGKSPEAFRGRKFNGRVPDDRMLEAVDKACDYIRGVAKGATILTEMEVQIPAMRGKGHLDAACVGDGRMLHVFDYKNGRHLVDPADNEQMKLYALGLWELLKGPRITTASKVRLHIVQPNANPEVGAHWDTTVGTLQQWGAKIVAPVADSILNGTAKINASNPEACRWCPRRGRCKQFAQASTERAKLDWADVVAGCAIPETPSELSAKELAALLEFRDTLDEWLKALYVEGMSRARLGKLPGYKVVAGNPRRVWTEYAAKSLKALLGAKAFTEPELIGITAAEKLLPAKTRAATMEGLTTKKPGGPLLARADDKRPTYSGDARLDFQDDLNDV